MPITLNGDTGITTPGLINTGSTTLINLTTTGNTILGDQSTDTLNVANGNLVLNSSGNLGLGISSPTQRLHVVAAGGYNATFSENSANNVRLQLYVDANETALVSGYNTTPKPMTFYTGGSLRATLDTSGNLGLGVTPSAWSGMRALQLGDGTFAMSADGAGAGDGSLTWNGYYNGTNWIYGYTGGGSSRYRQNESGHAWFYAPSGTAGNAISFTQAMTLNSSGNLGIGTTSPAARLDVSGGSIRVNEDGVGTKIITIRSDFAGVDPAINVTTSNSLLLMTSNTERARITSGGNFLVGTTGNGSPGFGVANSTNISFPESTDNTSLATMFRQAGSGDLVLGSGVRYSSTSNGFASSFNLAWARSAVNVGYGAIKFFTAAEATVSVGTDTTLTERARFDPSGNLGVGRTDPPMRLSAAAAGAVISGTATIGSNMQGIQIYNTTTATTNNAVGLWFATGPHQAGIASFRSAPDSGWDTVLAFYTHNATTSGLTDCYERMRVDGEGNVLVGTTSSNPSSGGLAFANTSFLGGAGWGIIASATSTASSYVGYFKNPNGAVGSIITSGSSTAYNTASDYRLKADIQPMTDALAKVASLKPVTYKWKIDGSDGQGFIAHELAEVMPQAVTGIKDAVDAEGNPQYQGIDVSFLVATLTAAIQELKAELDSVKSELATIKGAA